jgi:TetR/AcrR family transcriptional repressor of nem operon
VARTKAFDREAVLDKAMQVFWRQGYEATSLPDLTAAMGIGRQSLYDTFGDKHALYLAALDRYRRVGGGPLLALLERPGPVLPALRDLFAGIVDGACDGDRRGCFMVNATGELAGRDPETTQRAEANFAAMEEAFRGAITRAQAQGEILPDRDPHALARFLFATIQGLKVTAKAANDRAVLEDVVEVTLAALR